MSENTTVEQRLDRIERLLRGQKTVLNFAEACEFTGLSKTYMYKLTHQGRIPHFKPHGKNIYFNREELEQWLLQILSGRPNRKNAKPSITSSANDDRSSISSGLLRHFGAGRIFYQLVRQVCVFVVQKRAAEPRWQHSVGLLTRNQPMKQIPIHKGGRPTISEGRRKKYLLSLRLDAEHYFKLKALVRISGHGTAEVLRQLIAAGHVRERLCREHLDFMTQLKGVARNLNQLTRLAHAKGLTGIVSRHAAIVTSIEGLLRNLRDDR